MTEQKRCVHWIWTIKFSLLFSRCFFLSERSKKTALLRILQFLKYCSLRIVGSGLDESSPLETFFSRVIWKFFFYFSATILEFVFPVKISNWNQLEEKNTIQISSETIFFLGSATRVERVTLRVAASNSHFCRKWVQSAPLNYTLRLI